MRKRWLLCWWCILAFLSLNCSEPARESAGRRSGKKVDRPAMSEQEAAELKLVEERARQWLEMLDKGQYKEAWKNAGGLFTTAGSEGIWTAKIADGRRIVGTAKARKLLENYRTTMVPGAPPGDYYNLIFSTTFTVRPSGIEIVFLAREPDGEWRVSGYIVK